MRLTGPLGFGVSLSLTLSICFSLSLSLNKSWGGALHVCVYYMCQKKFVTYIYYLFSFLGLDFLKKMGDWNFIRLVSKRKWYTSFENENHFELTLNLNFVHKLCQTLFSTFQVSVSLSFHLFLCEFFKYPFLGDLSKFNAQLILSHAEVWKIN